VSPFTWCLLSPWRTKIRCLIILCLIPPH